MISRKFAGFYTLLMMSMILASCAVNPLKTAETTEQQAYAALGTFVIFQERAAAVVADPSVPAAAKQKIAVVENAAKPVVDSMAQAAIELAAIKAEVAAGTTSEEKLAIVNANLVRWVNEALPKIQAVVAAVKGAK